MTASPLGARVLAAAGNGPGGVVVVSGDSVMVLGGPGSPDPAFDTRLARLLGGRFGIGAVVPGSTPAGTGYSPAITDTDVPRAPAAAVSAALVNGAGVDPAHDDPGTLIASLLAAARRSGQRVVADPAWAAASTEAPASPADSESGLAVLIITSPPHDEWFRLEDRAGAELIESIISLAGPVPVTIMTTERVPLSLRTRWAAAGTDVLEGPEAWDRQGGDPLALAYRYSHVVLTAGAARSSVRSWVERTQPQATRIVYFPSLAFRDVSRIAPVSPPDEMPGLELVRLDVEDAVAHLAGWGHFAWCQWEIDAGVLRGWVPSVPAVVIPPALDTAPGRGPEGRRGVVMVAAEGHDVVGGHEDATLRAIEQIVPAVRARLGDPGFTVVADRPTPMLRRACRESDVEIVGSQDWPAVIAGARAVLAAHTYGAGQPATLVACLEAGTPFVCTPYAAADLQLGALAGVALCAAAEDMAARVALLLTDDRRWRSVVADGERLVQQLYPRAARDRALQAALSSAGLSPANHRRWPAPPPAPRPSVFNPPEISIRPVGWVEPPPLEHDGPTEERERYRLWHQRRGGANAAVLDAMAAEVERLAHRPVISVLVPVYNTDADVLTAAIDSVRSQVYPDWQLCVANDGSDRPETLEILRSLDGDPRVAVVDLPGSSGISAATNAALAVATGDYVTFLDHDDVLEPHALAQMARWLDADPTIDLLYSDEDKLDMAGRRYDPHIKPDWSPDLLTTQNYISHLTVARRSLVDKVGGLRPEFDGSQDYDLLLRLTEITDRIAHIPEPLYSWRAVPGSAAADPEAKPYAIAAARRAVADALRRRGYGDRVDTTGRVGFFRARYPVPGLPKVSVIVPTKDGRHLLERCLESVIRKTTYSNFEIVVVDNQSTDGGTLSYLATGPWRVIRYPHRFNYARMMNLAAASVDGDALLFLNNDTEIISPDWIESLLEHAMRPEVGAVGCRLFYGNGEPQHEGIMTGIGGWAHNTNHRGYWGRGEATRNVSAVTGACTMVRPSVFARVGGNDERLRVAYNDVDLCLRIRQAGYQVVYNPNVELYHHESSTRGTFEHEDDGPLYGRRWQVKRSVDPYYSPMFEDFPPFVIRL